MLENQVLEPRNLEVLERVKGFNFSCTAPMHTSRFVFSIGYVLLSHCQQARYVHQFVHHLWSGRSHPHAARLFDNHENQQLHFNFITKTFLTTVKKLRNIFVH